MRRLRSFSHINQGRLAFFESSNDIIISIAEDFTVADANPFTFQISGYDRKEVLGAPLRKFIPRKQWMSLKESIMKVFSGVVLRGEVDISTKTGGHIPLEFVGVPVVVDGRKYAQGIARDITDRKALQDFRYKMTQLLVHDLKNPLAPILVNVEFLKKKLQGSGLRGAEALGDITLCVEKLNKMIETMSELVRLENRILPNKRRLVRISDLLSSVFREFSRACMHHGVNLIVHRPPKKAVVYIDSSLVSRIFENLITNALHVLPHGGRIILSADVRPEETIFRVFDSGPGLSKRAFDILTSPDGAFVASTVMKYGALGLYFCRVAVEAHDGKIWAESKKGVGTSLYFSIGDPDVKGRFHGKEN